MAPSDRPNSDDATPVRLETTDVAPGEAESQGRAGAHGLRAERVRHYVAGRSEPSSRRSFPDLAGIWCVTTDCSPLMPSIATRAIRAFEVPFRLGKRCHRKLVTWL